MAYINTTTHRGQSLVSRIGQALVEGLSTYMERQSRQDQIRALEAKSDAELARMGIARDRIVNHVFRDRFYL